VAGRDENRATSTTFGTMHRYAVALEPSRETVSTTTADARDSAGLTRANDFARTVPLLRPGSSPPRARCGMRDEDARRGVEVPDHPEFAITWTSRAPPIARQSAPM
jgi:hypothetical protein